MCVSIRSHRGVCVRGFDATRGPSATRTIMTDVMIRRGARGARQLMRVSCLIRRSGARRVQNERHHDVTARHNDRQLAREALRHTKQVFPRQLVALSERPAPPCPCELFGTITHAHAPPPTPHNMLLLSASQGRQRRRRRGGGRRRRGLRRRLRRRRRRGWGRGRRGQRERQAQATFPMAAAAADAAQETRALSDRSRTTGRCTSCSGR